MFVVLALPQRGELTVWVYPDRILTFRDYEGANPQLF
jgi:hypothetical protein